MRRKRLAALGGQAGRVGGRRSIIGWVGGDGAEVLLPCIVELLRRLWGLPYVAVVGFRVGLGMGIEIRGAGACRWMRDDGRANSCGLLSLKVGVGWPRIAYFGVGYTAVEEWDLARGVVATSRFWFLRTGYEGDEQCVDRRRTRFACF